jgi:hypothetical protein
MSDMSQGPGWWIASDGKWYPPHLHPSVLAPETPPSAAGDPVDTALPGGFGSDPVGHGDPFAPADVGSPPPRRSRTPVAVVASIIVVILLVVGAVVVFGGTESASAKVVDAVNTTLSDGSAHVTMTLSGQADGTNLTGSGSGGINFTANDLQLQMTVGADGQQVPVNAIYQGGVIYESVPGLSTLAPGKSWISIDLSALQNAEAQNPSTGGLGSNPDVMLQMLAQQGNTVVPLGPSTVDGVAVEGYSVTVNPSAVAQQLKKASLPSWMQQAVAGLKVHDIHIKAFVDHSGLLRAFELQLTESSGEAGTVSFDETLGLSDYGTPVNVTAPPAGQVESFQQLLQTEGSLGSPSSSSSS